MGSVKPLPQSKAGPPFGKMNASASEGRRYISRIRRKTITGQMPAQLPLRGTNCAGFPVLMTS
jgi:hypothetical protein